MDEKELEQKKSQIIEMVESITSNKTINLIYGFVKRGYNEERK